MSVAKEVLGGLETEEYQDVKAFISAVQSGKPVRVRGFFDDELTPNGPSGRIVSFSEDVAAQNALKTAAEASLKGDYRAAKNGLDTLEGILFDRYIWSGEGSESLRDDLFTMAQIVSESLETLSHTYSEELMKKPGNKALADKRLKEFRRYIDDHVTSIRGREKLPDSKWLWEEIVDRSLGESSEEYKETIHAVADYLYTRMIPRDSLRRVAASAPAIYLERIGEELEVIGESYRADSTAEMKDAHGRLWDAVSEFNDIVGTEINRAISEYIREIIACVNLEAESGERFQKAKNKFTMYLSDVMDRYSSRLE